MTLKDAREEFNSKASCLQVFVCCELLFTFAFLGCLYVLQIDKLWDEKYLDSVVQDWERKPFIDVTQVDGSDPMKPCPAGFEVIGKAHFWGIKEGCSCPGTPGSITVGACSEQQKGCTTVPEVKPEWMDNIKGKRYCGKRGPDSRVTMPKPEPK